MHPLIPDNVSPQYDMQNVTFSVRLLMCMQSPWKTQYDRQPRRHNGHKEVKTTRDLRFDNHAVYEAVVTVQTQASNYRTPFV